MSIKRYISTKDNTISTAYRENLSARGSKANMGGSDILEIFSIYGQASSSSLEQSRVLLSFPTDVMASDRVSENIPASGSISFVLRLSNCVHGQTTPENYSVSIHPISHGWTEGSGLDMESYLDLESSNWISSSEGTQWHTLGGDYVSSSYVSSSLIPLQYTQSMLTGTEGIDIDITEIVEEWIKFHNSTPDASEASLDFLQNPTRGHTKAEGSLTISGNPDDKGTFKLSDTSTSQIFIINTDANDFDGTTDDSSGRTPIGIQGVLNNNDNIAERIKEAINGQTTVAITATRTNDKIELTQDNTGSLGNTEIILSNLGSVSKENFAGGTDSQVISLYSHEGENFTYTFITSSTYSVGNSVFLEIGENKEATAENLKERVGLDFGSKIKTSLAAAKLNLTQSVPGLHGNTIISSSISSETIDISPFSGGTTMPDYGIILKLQDEYEDGSKKKSYYTKKFYSRSSHEFFMKPYIEARWDSSIKDDRNCILKSSSISDSSVNLNNIFFYNRRGSKLGDIPDRYSALLVQLVPSLASSPIELPVAGGVTSGNETYVTASRVSPGVYRAQFEITGSHSSLRDIWLTKEGNTLTEFYTGSAFAVYEEDPESYYEIPDYTINITNLKDSYLQTEHVHFRVYTRNKSWKPNIYTVTQQTAPVNTIKEMYYKITRVSDNYQVLSYSTGSTPSYSSLSYDSRGSYFDFDMSLLEKNNSYEISFAFMNDKKYTELRQKFRFRVDP